MGDRSEKMGNRGQVIVNLQANSGPVEYEFTEIWTDLPFSKQVLKESNSLLECPLTKPKAKGVQ